MTDYSKGMIYMLEPTLEYEEGYIYYGSTTQPLHKRLFQHKHIFNHNKPGNSKLIFQKYGIENVKIILIKYYPCNNKNELEAQEATYIRNNKCVNRIIPGRSKQEYRETNKEKIQEYRDDNKDKKQEYDKKYRKTNIEKRKEKKRERINCECGCEIVKQNLNQHRTSKKHINLMKNIIFPVQS
jgi:hypothetical protein